MKGMTILELTEAISRSNLKGAQRKPVYVFLNGHYHEVQLISQPENIDAMVIYISPYQIIDTTPEGGLRYTEFKTIPTDSIQELIAAIDKRDYELNDLKMKVAGLNRILTYLKNTGKWPTEE